MTSRVISPFGGSPFSPRRGAERVASRLSLQSARGISELMVMAISDDDDYDDDDDDDYDDDDGDDDDDNDDDDGNDDENKDDDDDVVVCG